MQQKKKSWLLSGDTFETLASTQPLSWPALNAFQNGHLRLSVAKHTKARV